MNWRWKDLIFYKKKDIWVINIPWIIWIYADENKVVIDVLGFRIVWFRKSELNKFFENEEQKWQ